MRLIILQAALPQMNIFEFLNMVLRRLLVVALLLIILGLPFGLVT